MKKNALSALFSPRKEFAGLLQQLTAAADARIWVEDEQGQVLFGTPAARPAQTCPVESEAKRLGRVCGGEKAPVIAALLGQWISQETGRKKMGEEVLHLYRELNLIFSFSDLLANALRPDAIAQLAVEEASRVIRNDQGIVLFRPAPEAPFQVLHGNPSPEKTRMLEKLLKDGTANILPLPPETEAQWMLAAPLQLLDRRLGVILLLRKSPEEFSASDLKLLSALAPQVAAAMQSALLYEKEKVQALERQREELIIHLALRNPFYKRVVDQIDKNFSDPAFNVEKLSQSMHLSPSQLQRKILSLAEKSPSQLIRDKRLSRAKELLADTDLSISEIAWDCGFSDPSYFTRLFKKEEDQTPSDWKQNRNQP